MKKFSTEDRILMVIALTSFNARCVAEARAMDEMAKQFDNHKGKCAANAAASRRLAAQAAGLLKRL